MFVLFSLPPQFLETSFQLYAEFRHWKQQFLTPDPRLLVASWFSSLLLIRNKCTYTRRSAPCCRKSDNAATLTFTSRHWPSIKVPQYEISLCFSSWYIQSPFALSVFSWKQCTDICNVHTPQLLFSSFIRHIWCAALVTSFFFFTSQTSQSWKSLALYVQSELKENHEVH